MTERLVFKIFGYSEEEIRSALASEGIAPLSVSVECLDATLVISADSIEREDITLRVYALFPGCLYREGEGSLAETVLERLRLYNAKLCVAESLTGGMIASMLVDVPGCSESFLEGIVCYSNESKMVRLGVSPRTLEREGAVSEEVACQMATGLMRPGVNYALSTTGIAGPGGGTDKKPVGLVYIGVADELKCEATECLFEGTRDEVRRMSAYTALYLLWKRLVKPIDFENMVIE